MLEVESDFGPVVDVVVFVIVVVKRCYAQHFVHLFNKYILI